MCKRLEVSLKAPSQFERHKVSLKGAKSVVEVRSHCIEMQSQFERRKVSLKGAKSVSEAQSYVYKGAKSV